MKNVLVTGAAGFMGKNLVTALLRLDDIKVITINSDDDQVALQKGVLEADVIFHLAGVNRPKDEEEFDTGNAGLTSLLINILERANKVVTLVLPSSTQVILNNAYGRSKKVAEDAVLEYQRKTGAAVAVYRLPGVFGKWSRPNYNTVVATFCHNIARGLDITISDPDYELELVYIDDVVAGFLSHLNDYNDSTRQRYTISRVFKVTLRDLEERIRQLHTIRKTLIIPDLTDELMKCLHATYLSFLPEDDFSYPVKAFADERGWLFELIKSNYSGQIFVSKTLPGVTRGDHYHDTKLEKFCVVQGRGIIRFRHIHSDKILKYSVDDKSISVVDIPPGYTHSIENNGDAEMICLFWANQVFDPEEPDTYWERVIQ